jgi:hypothetical protein
MSGSATSKPIFAILPAIPAALVLEQQPTRLRLEHLHDLQFVYVASREASATNGAALKVEGGIVNTIC